MSFSTATKTTTVATFLRKHPSAGAALAGELYDRAYNWALDRADIRYSSVTISILQNVREYDLVATCLRVESVEWWTSADDCWKIDGRTTRQALDAQSSGWRTDTATIPTAYYIDSFASTGNLSKNVIGFREKMSAAPSGGYPQAIVRGQFVDSMGGSDTLPPILRDDTAILDKMYALYAKDAQPEQYALYEQIAEASAMALQSRVQRLQDEGPKRLFSGAVYGPRRRR